MKVFHFFKKMNYFVQRILNYLSDNNQKSIENLGESAEFSKSNYQCILYNEYKCFHCDFENFS